MGNAAVRRDLCVDVTTFLLVKVDLSLKDVDFLSCCLKLGPVHVLFELNLVLLFLSPLVVED